MKRLCWTAWACVLLALAASAPTAASTPSHTPATAPPSTTAPLSTPAPPNLTVRAATLIDASTGRRLYGDNADAEVPIASTTKLMTALVTLEHAKPWQVFTDPAFPLPAAASQIGLSPGERMTVKELMVALLLPSADDAAEDLAFNVGRRSVSRFIGMMNARAAELGLTHTHYSTPIGLDTPRNYSSASDLARLARYLLRTHPFFRRTVATTSAVLRSGAAERKVVNRNDLVGRIPWINGVKTGHTLDAGYVLVGSGTRNGMTLISVVLGTTSESSRDANTVALLNYGFNNFELRTPVKKGQLMAAIPVRGWPKLKAQLVAGGSFSRVFARSQRVSTDVAAPALLIGPKARGAVVGSVVVRAGGRRIARIPLALARALPAPPATSLWRPTTLIAIAVLLAAAIALIAWQLQRARVGRATEKRPA